MPTAAEELHAEALRAIDHGERALARRLVARALAAGPAPSVRARILVTQAYFVAERRSLAEGLALLDEADAVPDLAAPLRGLVLAQRGGLLMRAGDASAVAVLRRALHMLPAELVRDRALVLMNLGVLEGQHGHATAALSAFERSAELSSAAGAESLSAQARHNAGWTRLGLGDIARALRAMDEAAPVLQGSSPAVAAVCLADRAQALLAAGLLDEAADQLARAAATFGAVHDAQDRAEAELLLAQVHLARGRLREARDVAVRARRRFRRRGADTWEALARLVVLEVDARAGRRPAASRHAAVDLAERLLADGLPVHARRARLVAADASLLDAPEVAARVAGDALVLRRSDPLALRLHARRVRSAVALQAGDGRRADQELRAAVLEISRHQATLGSLDLKTAAGAHATSVTATGLRRALRGGSPAGVFAWAELGRGLSSRLSPVTPPQDPEVAALVQQLREVRQQLLQVPRGTTAAGLRERAAALERSVRERTWARPGAARALNPRPLADIRAALRAAGGALVAHLDVDGALVGLVVDGRGAQLHELGSAGEVVELGHRVHADLDLLAGTGLPAPLRQQATRSLTAGLRRLDDRLWAPLRDRCDGGPLVLAPSAVLTALPWTLLPGLRRRPVTVAVTATSWLEARDHRELAGAAFLTGPGLAHAQAEVAAAAACWTAPVLVDQASCADARSLAVAVDVLHVSAHGVHQPESPLFSHLRMSDGPLFGHELYELPRLPAHVVLSACALGRSAVRPGDESLGMTAALLAGGSRSVVAGTARVSDAAAASVGVRHHRGLRRGLTPAAALAVALAEHGADGSEPEGPPAPMVCFGAGW